MARILILSNHINPGGITSYILTARKAIEEEGHSVFLASSGGLYSDNFTHYLLPINGKNAFSLHNLLLHCRLSELVSQEKIDLLWAHTRITSVLSAIVSREKGIPYITTAHGFYSPNFGRRIFKCQGAITIAVSSAVKDWLVARLEYDSRRIEVLYNCLDPYEMELLKRKVLQVRDIARQNLGLPEDKLVIGMLSRLSPVKGWDIALEAMKSVEGACLLFFTTSDARYDGQLKDYLRDPALQGKVFCYQSNDLDKALFWSAIDLFLMPSRQEGFGLAALEAMQLGIPVLATQVGGLQEVVNEDVGFLVPEGDSSAITGILDMLVFNKELLAEKRKLLPDYVEKFSFHRFRERLDALIGSVIEPKLCNNIN